LLAGALGYIAREQTTEKTPPPIPLLLYDVITGTDPKENIVSNPPLLHDVITETDPQRKHPLLHWLLLRVHPFL
jgi:hypothetical protein